MRRPALAAALGLAAMFGLRALPAAAAPPPIDAYGKLPAVELIRLSPAGDMFAFIIVTGESRRLAVATLAGKGLVASDVGTTKVVDLAWVDEDHLLVGTFATEDLRYETGQKYELENDVVIDVKKVASQTIFLKDRTIGHAVFGRYGFATVEGHRYGYFGGITFEHTISNEYLFDHGWPDLYRVDLDTGKATLESKGDERDFTWVVNSSGAVVAHAIYDGPSGQWRLIQGGGLGKTVISRNSPIGAIDLVGQGRTPGTVLILDNTGDRSTVEEATVADGSTTELFKDGSVTDYLNDPVSGLLIGALTDDESGATFFDPQLDKKYQAVRRAFPGLQVHLTSYSEGLDRMIVKTDGGRDSGTYWLVDIAAGSAARIGSAYPDIKKEDIGETSRFAYKAQDGLEMDGVLTLPPGRDARNLPVVVMPHGGPIDVWDKPGFDFWAQAFASRGYAVFQPNYRGSGGRSIAFRQAGFGQWGRKMQTDVSDGLAALAARGIVDPKRACIVGASYGGYAALAGVTLQHGLYRCAVSVSGPANMSSFFHWEETRHGYKSAATRYWRQVTGADSGGEAVMRQISPTTFAKDADAPILLIHGKDDTVVPPEQSVQMDSALKAAGKPVQLILINGGDHWELHEDARVATVKASVEWVLKYDPPN